MLTVTVTQVRAALGDLVRPSQRIYNEKRKAFRRVKVYRLNPELANLQAIEQHLLTLGAFEVCTVKDLTRRTVSVVGKFSL